MAYEKFLSDQAKRKQSADNFLGAHIECCNQMDKMMSGPWSPGDNEEYERMRKKDRQYHDATSSGGDKTFDFSEK